VSRLPVQMAPNLVEHFYLGGARISSLRGIEVTSPRQPEEWLAATVSRADEPGVGLARTITGEILRDLVVANPQGWLGLTASSGDVGILVKLLDAGARLPVHVHPDRAFASRHLDCPYGKTEAWYILDAEEGASVHLGWLEDIDLDELVRARDAQDSGWLLGHMNEIPVRPGDGILVPAGTAHAIGEGVFLTEVQEPTDFSILLEWSVTTSTRDESHLGLGFDRAMQSVRQRATTSTELSSLVIHSDPAPGAVSVLPAAGDEFFRLHRVGDGAVVAPGFAVVLVLDGTAILTGTGEFEVTAGQVYAVPAGFGRWTPRGDAALLVARPGAGWRGL
jgi:mannose-6-phosphate isomerase